MASVLVTSVQIPKLLEKLNAFGDKSFQIRSILVFLKLHPSEQNQVWVDVWPEFTSIVVTQHLPENIDTLYYFFTLDIEKLRLMLEDTDIVKWENAIFRAYPYHIHQIIEDNTRKRGLRLRCQDFLYRLYKFNAKKWKQSRPVPEDITVGSLTPDMAYLVSTTWPVTIFDEKVVPLIKYLINNYPSVCLYDLKGAPVAFEMYQEYACLGMLFVEPAYRNRGLGKLVVNLLVQKCADQGYLMWAGVTDDNEASIKVHVDAGFEETDVMLIWSKVIRKET